MPRVISQEDLEQFRKELADALPLIRESIENALADTGQAKTVLEEGIRLSHSVRGAAAMVRLHGVRRVAEIQEWLLDNICADVLPIDEKAIDLLLVTLESLDQTIYQLELKSLNERPLLVNARKALAQFRGKPQDSPALIDQLLQGEDPEPLPFPEKADLYAAYDMGALSDMGAFPDLGSANPPESQPLPDPNLNGRIPPEAPTPDQAIEGEETFRPEDFEDLDDDPMMDAAIAALSAAMRGDSALAPAPAQGPSPKPKTAPPAEPSEIGGGVGVGHVDRDAESSFRENAIVNAQTLAAEIWEALRSTGLDVKLESELILDFCHEAEEEVHAILSHCREILRDPLRHDLIRQSRRTIHTLKGAAGAMGVNPIAHRAHQIEDMIDPLLDENHPLTEDKILPVSQAVEAVEDIVVALKQLCHHPAPHHPEHHPIPAPIPIPAPAPAPAAAAAAAQPKPPQPQPAPAPQFIKPRPSHKTKRTPNVGGSPDIILDDLSKIDPELLEVFHEESEMHLSVFDQTLNDLKVHPDSQESLQDLRRAAHTLKGAAGSVKLMGVSRLAHRMEDLLDQLYDAQLPVTRHLHDVLLQTSDILHELIEGGYDVHNQQTRVQAVLERYSEILNNLEDFLASESQTQAATQTEVPPSRDDADDSAAADFPSPETWPTPAIPGATTIADAIAIAGVSADSDSLAHASSELHNAWSGAAHSHVFFPPPPPPPPLPAATMTPAPAPPAVNDFSSSYQASIAPAATHPAATAPIFRAGQTYIFDPTPEPFTPATPEVSAMVNDFSQVELGLLEVFAMEVENHLRNSYIALSTLERQPENHEALQDLRRNVQSLLKAAASVKLQGLSRLAERMQKLLLILEDRRSPISPPHLELMMSSTDVILDISIGRYDVDAVARSVQELISRYDQALIAAESAAQPVVTEAASARTPGAITSASAMAGRGSAGAAGLLGETPPAKIADELSDDDLFPLRPGIEPEFAPIELDDLDLISSELLEVFALEAEDHLRHIYVALSALEKQPDNRESLLQIRRCVHTLKGAAGAVKLRGLTQMAHQMEDLLEFLTNQEAPVSSEILSLLMNTTDVLLDMSIGQFDKDSMRSAIRKIQAGYSRYLSQAAKKSRVTEFAEHAYEDDVLDWAKVSEYTKAFIQPGAQKPAREPDAPTRRAVGENLRVPIERIDELVRLVSELVINRTAFEQRMSDFVRVSEEIHGSMERMRQVSTELEAQYEVSALLRTNRFQWQFGPETGPGPGSGAGSGFLPNQSRWNFPGNPPQNLPPVPIPSANLNLDFFRNSAADEFDELEMDRYSQFHLLMRGLSESTSDMYTVGNELNTLIGDFGALLIRQGRLTREIQDKLMRVRMVPLGTIAPTLHRNVRSVASQQGKLVDLILEGEHVELDKTVLEEMAEPFLHLLRNAVDHGVEPPGLRMVKGKPEKATIRIRAFYQGTQVVIQVNDDGAGIDPANLRATAIRNGHISPGEAEQMSREEILQLIFIPGFSTAKELSEVSGRGVGMDIVKAKVNRLKGTLSIDSALGVGTSFTIRLPMTLAITRALLVKANGESFAIPVQAISQLSRVERDRIQKVGREPVIRLNDKLYPMVLLGDLLKLRHPPDTSSAIFPVLVVTLGNHQVAVAVDQLVANREIVVKTLGNHLRRVHGLIGATLMGDGTVIPILNIIELIQEPGRVDLHRSSMSLGQNAGYLGEALSGVNAEPHAPALALGSAAATATATATPKATTPTPAASRPSSSSYSYPSSASSSTAASGRPGDGVVPDGRARMDEPDLVRSPVTHWGLESSPPALAPPTAPATAIPPGAGTSPVADGGAGTVSPPTNASMSPGIGLNWGASLGGGASFPPPPPPPPPPKPAPPKPRQEGGENLNILIVDDSVSVRRVVGNLIKSVGWNPIPAKDGLDALEVLQRQPQSPDLALLDIEMPRMDGYELLGNLRSQSMYRHLPVIMVTSRAGQKHRQKALELGATDYVIKPYQDDTLLALIRDHVRKFRAATTVQIP